MKIVFVITGLDWAGAEIQLRDLALELTRRGDVVDIISLAPPKAFVAELTAGGVAVRDLGLDRDQKTPLALVRSVRKLRQLINAAKPDVVHAHMVHANLLTRLAMAWGKWPPLICTAHNTHEGGALRDWAYRLTNRWSTLDTTISEAATTRYLNDKVFRPKRTLTVRNGIDTTKFMPAETQTSPDGGSFRWVAVGRLHEQKDYPTLFAALQSVPDAHLDVVGRGDLDAQLKDLVQQLQLSDRVNFLGIQTDLPDLLPRYDGFVLSSAWEGFGLVVAEAMSSGLPVVATRSGGPQEIVGDDETTGFLVPPRSPTDLAQAMNRMASLPSETRRQMGLRGRQRIVDHFSITAAADRWQTIYQDILADRAAQ